MIGDFRRVTKAAPCPICGKPNWCLIGTPDGEHSDIALCQRVPSDKPGMRWREAGWAHVLSDNVAKELHKMLPKRSAIDIDHETHSPEQISLLHRFQKLNMRDHWWKVWEDETGLPRDASEAFGLGCIYKTGDNQIWTIPNYDATGDVIGLSTRGLLGRKWMVKGSRLGTYAAKGMDCTGRTLYVCEGATDAMALHALDQVVIGRHNATQGGEIIRQLCVLMPPKQIRIVADNDGPGREGAEKLADELRRYSPILTAPPSGHKDVRAWYLATRGRVVAKEPTQ